MRKEEEMKINPPAYLRARLKLQQAFIQRSLFIPHVQELRQDVGLSSKKYQNIPLEVIEICL